MGILDGFLGKPPRPASSAAASTSDQPSSDNGSRSSQDSSRTEPEAVLERPSTSAPNQNLLRDLSPHAVASASQSLGSGGITAGRLHDPYEGIGAVGLQKSRSAFKLPQRPEFVFEEEAAVRRRGWTENLQFYTGLGYITGATTGVAAGGYRYISVKPELAVESFKLKTNRFLNAAGSFARPFGNGCGILGLFFASSESLLNSQLEALDLPESASTVMAGALAGALFRTPRGPRQAVVAGAVGAVAGSGISVLRQFFPAL